FNSISQLSKAQKNGSQHAGHDVKQHINIDVKYFDLTMFMICSCFICIYFSEAFMRLLYLVEASFFISFIYTLDIGIDNEKNFYTIFILILEGCSSEEIDSI